MTVVDVILPYAVEGSFTYLLPASCELPQSGQRIVVPLGQKKLVTGIIEQVREAAETEDTSRYREADYLPETFPMVTPEQLRLWHWMAAYYMCTVGEVMRAALPGSLRVEKESRPRKKAQPTYEIHPANALNEEQTRAIAEIREAWGQKATVLLHGVTSSGKTEVYIHLAQEFIAQGKQVLYLVPEIALTTQLTDRLRSVFGERLGVYHSRFTDRERAETYKHVLTGDRYDIIIGVRSSLFLPFRRLGLVIVDEEHDTSYKQQDPAPRYHARTTAQMLASIFGARTLLGTATPAVETYYNALQGKYGLVQMTKRYRGLSLPAIHLLDLHKAYKQKRMEGHFSLPLVTHMREQLDEGKQVLLFQNRRGYNAYVECPECGFIPKCANCDVSLTEHKPLAPDQPSRLVCHYCGYTIPAPAVCPDCGKGVCTWRPSCTSCTSSCRSRRCSCTSLRSPWRIRRR